MFVSKPGKALLAGVLAAAAVPALAAEAGPLDDAALGRITAQGVGELGLVAWLPEPDNIGLLPSGEIGPDQAVRSGGLVLGVLKSGNSVLSLERGDSHGAVSQIVQTAAIDLPNAAGSQAAGVIMQTGGYVSAGGGQSATNLAVAATLNGAGSFGPFRP